MEIVKEAVLDILDTPGVPALSSTSDVPVVETRPDASNEGKPPDASAAVPEGTEQPEDSATSATEEAPAEPAKKESRGVQKALDRLTAEREDQRRRAEAAEERLDKLLQTLEKTVGTPKEEAKPSEEGKPVKPVRADFADPDAYETAFVEYARAEAQWTAKHEIEEARKQEREKAEAESREAQLKTLNDSYLKRVEAAKTKYADFKEVAERSDLPVAAPIAAAIWHSEHGAELQYYLGKNPDVLARLNGLPPPLQTLELGVILGKMQSGAPLVTNAPKPPAPLRPTSEPARKNPEDMSMEEYAAYARERDKRMRH